MKLALGTILVLAMSPLAFGAVSLDWPSDVVQVPAGATSVTLPLTLTITAGEPVTGVTFALSSDKPGMLRISDRVIDSADLPDPTTSNSLLLNATNSLLNPKSLKDAGVGAPDGVTPAQGTQKLMTLTFEIDPAALPATISIVGVGTAAQGVWADPDFSTWPLPVSTVSLVAIPEPASMLLLAAGAAFFARRRRA